MKLKNKQTGEIVEVTMPITDGDGWRVAADSLAELNADWEDVPKGFVIDIFNVDGYSKDDDYCDEDEVEMAKELGIWAESEGKLKEKMEKMKALKRLMDHNLRIGRGKRTFVNTDVQLTHQVAMFTVVTYDKVEEDLDLLFPKGDDRWTGMLLD